LPSRTSFAGKVFGTLGCGADVGLAEMPQKSRDPTLSRVPCVLWHDEIK
jgi:hypothetical protein